MLRIFLVLFLLINTNVFAEDLKKVYFGGGCFWCMEESFDKAEGVKDVISGYSGGTTKNPTYKEVTYGNTGHFEVVEIIYDSKITNLDLSFNYIVKVDMAWVEGYIRNSKIEKLNLENNYIDNHNIEEIKSFKKSLSTTHESVSQRLRELDLKVTPQRDISKMYENLYYEPPV